MAGLTLGLTNVIRGIGGHPELSRVIGFAGGVAYIVCTHAFIAWDLWAGRTFDLVAYCVAFPTGLAAVTGGTAAAVAIKDRNVARAKVTEKAAEV